MTFLKNIPLAVLLFPSIAYCGAHNCVPDEVGQIDSRIHIRCENTVQDGGNTISYFAVSTVGSDDEPAISNRFLSVGMTGLTAGKSVVIIFDDGDTSGATFGCGPSNCRKARAFFLAK